MTRREEQEKLQQRIKKCWMGLAILLLFTLIAELLWYQIPEKALQLESYPFFYAWFPAFVSLILIIIAKILGFILKRPSDYYQSSKEDHS